jgi:hypothetical protein
MTNYGTECDRCERPREDGAPYKRWQDRYECKPGWEYTAPMMRAREAALAEEWESEIWAPKRPHTAEEIAQAAAWQSVVNATCKEVLGHLEDTLPSWSGYHDVVSNADRNRAKAARRKARGK